MGIPSVYVFAGTADLWLQNAYGCDWLKHTNEDGVVQETRGIRVPQRSVPWVFVAAVVPHAVLIPGSAVSLVSLYSTARGMSDEDSRTLSSMGFPLDQRVPVEQHYNEEDMEQEAVICASQSVKRKREHDGSDEKVNVQTARPPLAG
eukprot:1547591-Amphidinium_carterae.6